MNFFNLHTHFITKQNFSSIINIFPEDKIPENNYFSVGIHPCFINDDKIEHELKLIEDKLQHKNCLCLGECGLDKLATTSLIQQTEVFVKQLLLAEKYAKPVIVHCVKVHQEVLNLHKKKLVNIPLIFHGFNKNLQILNLILKDNHFVSIGTSVIKSIHLQNIVKLTPTEKLFLETDENKIHSIEEVYSCVAKIKAIELEELKLLIHKNFEKVFILNPK